MKRAAHFLSLVMLVSVFIAACQKTQQQENKSLKPNIIYILADDLGYGDIGPFGQQKIRTPNLDRMAGEGMRFTQHYAGSTVCAPSRSVLMTGMHTGHTPIRGNKKHTPIGQYPLPDSVMTIAEVLKQAGYTTGAFGKWGLGYPASEGSPGQQGFDYFFGYNGQRRAHFYYPEFLFKETAGHDPERVPLEGNEVDDTSRPGFPHPGSGPPKKRGTYSQDAIMKEALAFIDRQAAAPAPFFAYLPLNIPHASLIVPEQALKVYTKEGESIFIEEPFSGGHYTAQPRPRAAYAAMVTLLDRYVGQVLEKLREQEIGQNTLVIFTSDNGSHAASGHDPTFFDSNGSLRGIKRDLYEGGIRVPMIAWWPGTVPADTTSDHISAFQDMMPTVAQLAGVQAPSHTDGISLVPTLKGQGTQKKHEYLYWEFPARGGKQAVRMGKWKAIWLGVSKNPKGPIELYNLQEDPTESRNVADQHPDIVEQMKQIMQEAHIPSEIFPLTQNKDG